MSLHPVAAQLLAIRDELASVFFERRRVIDGLILGLLTNEHAVALGPPGTAKTALGKALYSRIEGSTFFKATLSKSRPAEAILGPYDIPSLRDEGHLHRKIAGFLPTVGYAMLDEIGKMSSTLGHDLLNVLLDRELDQVNGGRSTLSLPLRCVFGGMNELPTDENEDAAALWDRLLIRLVVDYLQEKSNVAAMLMGSIEIANPKTVKFEDLADVADNVVPAIILPADVVEVVLQLREMLSDAGIVVSDRRLKQSMKLLRASAFLGGRSEVNTDDVQVLRHALWETPSQIVTVERLTLTVSNPVAAEALKLLEKAEEIATEIRDSKGLADDKKAALTTKLNGRLKSIETDLGKVRAAAVASGSSLVKVDEVIDRVTAISDGMWRELMGFDPTGARARTGAGVLSR